MTVLVVYNQNEKELDTGTALKDSETIFIEASGFRDGLDLPVEKVEDIHAIMTNYKYVMEDSSFLRKLARNEMLKDVPLILCLTPEEQENIKPLKHSAPYHLLQTPFSSHALRSMVLSAESEFFQRRTLRQQIHSRQSVIGSITRGTFRIKTFEQAEALTTMLSLACPEPDRVAFGLFELLANSIEHGNLDIDSEEKKQLIENNRRRDEINRRLALPEYRDKFVEIIFERERDLVSFKIEDQGRGFNYNDHMDTDLSTNQTQQGRGIALARATSFDYMEFLGKGNKVLAIAKFAPH